LDRDEALKLLRGGEKGVAEWNRRSEFAQDSPALDETNLREANLRRACLTGSGAREE
jgi:hypothetical protein